MLCNVKQNRQRNKTTLGKSRLMMLISNMTKISLWKTAGLSIIKKHSGEMSVCMGQGQKPILNVCVLWTVNIKNRPSFIVGIWNFRKTMWANPVFRWHFKCKFKFYQARKELEKDSESHLLCLSPSSFKMDWDQVENCPVGKLKTTEKGKATICNGLVTPYCTYCEGSINAKQHL